MRSKILSCFCHRLFSIGMLKLHLLCLTHYRINIKSN